ncbi:cyclic nucleotide-binding domain-containing protein [Flavobacterium defluvii]|uniref:Cyclic nucleotide-binding domain-containing protein n=1 Tax=Flavobacterium defluvii TaxID=370979 RepID=A0A1M5VQ23_9FLAO|nr:cyclic nucleotide-binding domain-containing protein [Flavobacterium defluvii]SHH77290.1 Cyclic nucleotide-binding domain-containing protein [Flavobacterium defluvii]
MKRALFFLGQFNNKDVEWLIHNGQKIELGTGEKLIQKGNFIDSLYIVLSGQLSVCAESGDKEDIATLGTGEVVGEMSFLETRPPSVSVIAKKTSVVYKISREIIELRLTSNPDFKANFYYALALFLSNRLRKTTDQLGYGTPEEEDLIDTKILDGVAQAGARFGQILHRFSEA